MVHAATHWALSLVGCSCWRLLDVATAIGSWMAKVDPKELASVPDALIQ